ncbi:MAG TPA: hypothetical protein VM658_02880 [bacterium]|nr:hypothetical protein [bacterium]
MNSFAAASIFFGIVLIVTRVPFILAPAAARDALLRFISSTGRVRVVGLFVGAMGAAMVMAAQGSYRLEVMIVLGTGWALIMAAAFGFLIFTRVWAEIVRAALTAMEDFMLRGMGAISVLIGAMFIYMGVLEIK